MTPKATLIPVLELAPFDYASRERSSPEGSAEANPEGWHQYWRDSLADAGITELRPWTPGSWMVPLDQLTVPSTLRAILTHEFERITSDDDLDGLSAMSGGFVLSRSTTHLTPQCCCDLANLADWKEAALHEGGDWTQVWIGHPWTHVRAEGDELVFAEPTETSPPAPQVEALRVSRRDLQAGIESASRSLDAFASRLVPVIQGFPFGASARRLASLLVHGHP